MDDGAPRYRFLAVLGEGAFGRVYRASMDGPQGFRRDVAIKVLHDVAPRPEVLRRFRDEARILARLRDRAIVRVDAPVRLGDRWCLVMEYVDGASCAALIARGPVPPGVAVEIAGEIARALHHAHLGGDEEPLRLLHRDIKPENVQVTPAGEVKLLDLGIAQADLGDEPADARTTGIVGTPGYIAPERLQGVELPAGDVYSLGVVLHELVTGQRVPALLPGEIPDADAAIARDQAVAPVLALAARMRAHRAEDRPAVREVERACRELRQALPAPWLHDWAEVNVPPRGTLAADGRVGATLTAPATADADPVAVPDVRWTVIGSAALVALLGIAIVASSGPAARPVGNPPAQDPPLEPVASTRPPARADPVAPISVPAAAPRPVPARVVAEAPVAAQEPVAAHPTFDVVFASVPPGARVELPDASETLGTTPVRRSLPAGPHRVRMTTAEGASSETTVMVGRRRPTRYLWRAQEARWESGY